jgi:hypothetical protein
MQPFADHLDVSPKPVKEIVLERAFERPMTEAGRLIAVVGIRFGTHALRMGG